MDNQNYWSEHRQGYNNFPNSNMFDSGGMMGQQQYQSFGPQVKMQTVTMAVAYQYLVISHGSTTAFISSLTEYFLISHCKHFPSNQLNLAKAYFTWQGVVRVVQAPNRKNLQLLYSLVVPK